MEFEEDKEAHLKLHKQWKNGEPQQFFELFAKYGTHLIKTRKIFEELPTNIKSTNNKTPLFHIETQLEVDRLFIKQWKNNIRAKIVEHLHQVNEHKSKKKEHFRVLNTYQQIQLRIRLPSTQLLELWSFQLDYNHLNDNIMNNHTKHETVYKMAASTLRSCFGYTHVMPAKEIVSRATIFKLPLKDQLKYELEYSLEKPLSKKALQETRFHVPIEHHVFARIPMPFGLTLRVEVAYASSIPPNQLAQHSLFENLNLKEDYLEEDSIECSESTEQYHHLFHQWMSDDEKKAFTITPPHIAHHALPTNLPIDGFTDQVSMHHTVIPQKKELDPELVPLCYSLTTLPSYFYETNYDELVSERAREAYQRDQERLKQQLFAVHKPIFLQIEAEQQKEHPHFFQRTMTMKSVIKSMDELQQFVDNNTT